MGKKTQDENVPAGMKLHILHKSREFLGVVFTLDLTKEWLGATWDSGRRPCPFQGVE